MTADQIAHDLAQPAEESRHPDELFLLALCVVSGFTLAFGDVPAPGTLEASVPGWAVTLWAWGLLIGPVVTLLGIFAPWKRTTDGAIVEQIGQVMVGGMAAFYGFVLLVAAWPASILAGSITLGFAAARFARWYQLQKRLRAIHRASKAGASDGA